MAQKPRATSLAVCLATLGALVKADIAVRCELIGNESIQNIGGWDLYTNGVDLLRCYAFELLCLQLQEGSTFTLESLSVDERIACGTSCICNDKADAWAGTATLTGG